MHQSSYRSAAVMCIVLLLVLVVPAKLQADPLGLADVTQAIVGRSNHQDAELRVNSISLERTVPTAGGTASSAPANDGNAAATTSASTSEASPTLNTVSAAPQEGPGGNIETVEFGDITGTVCDCGELVAPPAVFDIPGGGGGGFPKWPLLALAVIPLFFIGGGGGESIRNPEQPAPLIPMPTPAPPTPTPTPTTPPGPTPTPTTPPVPTPTPTTPPVVPPPPTPTPEPIPEPATLILFGTSLLALGTGVRRRRRARQDEEITNTTAIDEEV